jgi:prepilin-type N-terminal cleavage/methylation domain-containing protein
MKTAFTLIELLVVIAILAIMAAMLLPTLANGSDRSERAIDMNNLRQTLVAMQMYCKENNDHLPHPTWGTVSTDPGPDGWAYATRNNGRFPGLPGQIPSASGRLNNTNQLPWFERGLLGPYLAKDQKLLDCPKDVRLPSGGQFLALYGSRELKLTSYGWNGAVCGYGSLGREVPNANSGATFKLSGFKAADFLMWEADEWHPYNFNDAGQNPVNLNEGISKRHAGGNPTDVTDLGGGAIVGRFGGGVDFIKWGLFRTLQTTGGGGKPNELLCGPGYR